MENAVTSQGAHPPDGDTLKGVRRRAEYRAAERAFSTVLQQQFQELLEGKRNSLDLLRKYPGEADRLGIISLPSGIRRDELRLPVVEDLIWKVVEFMRSTDDCGPIVQEQRPDGTIVERQEFPTKYPHIVIERTDCFPDGSVDPTEITWTLRRVQNQRAQTQLNRVIDVANLAFELFRVVR